MNKNLLLSYKYNMDEVMNENYPPYFNRIDTLPNYSFLSNYFIVK
jgi:hypothetical protein